MKIYVLSVRGHMQFFANLETAARELKQVIMDEVDPVALFNGHDIPVEWANEEDIIEAVEETTYVQSTYIWLTATELRED